MIPPITPGVVTALGSLLVLLNRVGPLRADALVALAKRSSLRAGALPFTAALQLGCGFDLIVEQGEGELELGPDGRNLCRLLGDEPEPTNAFREVVASLVLAASPVRVLAASLEITMDHVSLRRADGDVILSWLADAGLAEQREGGWHLVGLARILAVGALTARASERADSRDEIGALGEQLSFRYETERLGRRATPIQVSRISSVFGFDLLSHRYDGDESCPIAIEVKATEAAGPLPIFLSRHEALVARQLGDVYYLHTWGSVDPSRSVEAQYQALRRFGYPIVVRHVAAVLGESLDTLLTPRQTPDGWPLVGTELRCDVPAPAPVPSAVGRRRVIHRA